MWKREENKSDSGWAQRLLKTMKSLSWLIWQTDCQSGSINCMLKDYNPAVVWWATECLTLPAALEKCTSIFSEYCLIILSKLCWRKWKRKDLSAVTSHILRHYFICLHSVLNTNKLTLLLHAGVKHAAVFKAILLVVPFDSSFNGYERRSCLTAQRQRKAAWPWGSRLLQNLSTASFFFPLPRQSKWFDPLVTGEIKSNFTRPQSRLILLIR